MLRLEVGRVLRLACLLRPRARASGLLRSAMVAHPRCRLATISTTFRLDGATKRIHEVHDLRLLAFAWRFNLLARLLFLQQLLECVLILSRAMENCPLGATSNCPLLGYLR